MKVRLQARRRQQHTYRPKHIAVGSEKFQRRQFEATLQLRPVKLEFVYDVRVLNGSQSLPFQQGMDSINGSRESDTYAADALQPVRRTENTESSTNAYRKRNDRIRSVKR